MTTGSIHSRGSPALCARRLRRAMSKPTAFRRKFCKGGKTKMKSRHLRAERAKLIEEARELIERKNPTAEDVRKFDRMMVRADEMKAQIDRAERAEADG